jgi:nucleoside-diphosphate-sugar epimerase
MGLIELAGMMTGKSDEVARLLGSLCIDSSKIRSELGWTPSHTLTQGLAETARWFRGRDNRG